MRLMKIKRAKNIRKDTGFKVEHSAITTARFVWKQIGDVLVDAAPGEYNISEYVKLVVVADTTIPRKDIRLEIHSKWHDVHVGIGGESYIIGGNKFDALEYARAQGQFSETNDTAYITFGFDGARAIPGLRRTKLKPGHFVCY
ncbi:MAG: hypothetical protein LBR41_03455, partial [Rickettsiales bacterium]|nr:hypothetical protein [Rickettsiales bacterium]